MKKADRPKPLRKITHVKASSKAERLKLRHCNFCHKYMDDLVCPIHKIQTFPNTYIKRFPRLGKADISARKAASRREPSDDLWYRNRPMQGGLPS